MRGLDAGAAGTLGAPAQGRHITRLLNKQCRMVYLAVVAVPQSAAGVEAAAGECETIWREVHSLRKHTTLRLHGLRKHTH